MTSFASCCEPPPLLVHDRVTTDPVCYQSDSLTPGLRAYRMNSNANQYTLVMPDGTSIFINMYWWGGQHLVRMWVRKNGRGGGGSRSKCTLN